MVAEQLRLWEPRTWEPRVVEPIPKRCQHCGGNIIAEWEEDLREQELRCLQCGRGITQVVLLVAESTRPPMHYTKVKNKVLNLI